MLIPRPNRLYHRIRARTTSCAEDTQVLEEISGMYGLGRLASCRLPGAGRKTRTVVLSSEHGRWALKQYPKDMLLSDVIFVHSVLTRLGELSFAAPRLKLTRDGQDFVALAGRYYALLDFIPGHRCSDYYVLPQSLRYHYIEQAGATLASFHRIIAGFLPHGQRAEGYQTLGTKARWDEYCWYCEEWDRLVSLSAQPGNGARLLPPATASYIEKKLSELHAREEEQPLLPVTVIHGDYGPYNLLFDSHATCEAILDFDGARLEQRMDEVAASLRRFAESKNGGLALPSASAFLKGYQATHSLPEWELEQLPAIFQRIRLRGLVKALRIYLDTGSDLARYNVYHAIEWLKWLDTQGSTAFRALGEN